MQGQGVRVSLFSENPHKIKIIFHCGWGHLVTDLLTPEKLRRQNRIFTLICSEEPEKLIKLESILSCIQRSLIVDVVAHHNERT